MAWWNKPNGKGKGNGGKKKKVANVASRANATRVLAQGAGGKPPRRAFGGVGKVSNLPRGLPFGAWDATCTSHAALPRAVGPYTVVRTTRMFTSKAGTIVFGTFIGADNTHAFNDPESWTNVIAASQTMADATVTPPITTAAKPGDPDGTTFITIPVPSATGAAGVASSTFSCVPAAITVQVMCPNPLQLAGGQAAMAVVPARLDLSGPNQTWDSVNQQLISYFKPRLLTGGKLALRGVQCSSFPLSMAQCSKFMGCSGYNDMIDAWNHDTRLSPEGWAPIVFMNQSQGAAVEETHTPYTFLVTVEWRVRFDISNPAVSSHQQHPTTSDSAWEEGIKRATNVLPGVIDVVEKVANAVRRYA